MIRSLPQRQFHILQLFDPVPQFRRLFELQLFGGCKHLLSQFLHHLRNLLERQILFLRFGGYGDGVVVALLNRFENGAETFSLRSGA